jgi:hypothetical protein
MFCISENKNICTSNYLMLPFLASHNSSDSYYALNMRDLIYDCIYHFVAVWLLESR